MNTKTKGRLVFIVSLIFMLAIVLLNFHMSVRFLRFSRLLVEEKLTSNVSSLNFHLQESERNTRTAAVTMSQDDDLIQAVINRDTREIINILSDTYGLFRVNYYTVTDHEGIVLARTHEPDHYGDSVIHQQNIIDALNGEISTYYEEGTAVTVSVRTGSPVYDENGFIIGVISAGIRFDTDESVDELSGILNSDVSVFFGETRVSTTLTRGDGSRAHGTLIRPEIAKTVIEEKIDYTGEVNLFGKFYETYYKPLINSDDETFAIIVLGVNIDDLKRESNALFFEAILIGLMGITIAVILLHFLREALQANTAKSTFLSRMSHEIRTPMNAIIGITEIQLRNKKIEGEVKEAFARIYSSGDMLLGIINDILDLSKIEAGKLELSTSDYEIASLISDTSQLNMMRVGSKPIEFELIIDENIPSVVSGDELRVKQILNNLLSNAFKYTQEGKVTLSVGMEKNENSKKVMFVFKISDTGQGMTKEQVARLFEDYARFNNSVNRKTEGTGLGMGITRNLVRMMGGSISVKSEPEKGTEITVRLQQEKIGSETLGKEMTENLLKFRSGTRSRMKRTQISYEPMPYGSVLIVDDAEMNIYVAKGLLTPYQLKMDDAESGFKAIEKIKDGNVYDIIFMDHMMPEMDGIETVKKIREMGYDHPIVALTANAISGQSEIFLENGFDDFISKPIDIRQMNMVLNKFIRDKKSPTIRKNI